MNALALIAGIAIGAIGLSPAPTYTLTVLYVGKSFWTRYAPNKTAAECQRALESHVNMAGKNILQIKCEVTKP